MSYNRYFGGLEFLASVWLFVSTFLIKMPLRINWTIRMFAVVLLITGTYTLIQVVLMGDVSSAISVIALLVAVAIVAVGYTFGWPGYVPWISTLGGSLGVVVGALYLIYTEVEPELVEGAETPV